MKGKTLREILKTREYAIFASYGNDSIALIQWMAEHGHADAYVVYSDTKWSRPDWEATRVEPGEALARRHGMHPLRITSDVFDGFMGLVRKKNWFPSGRARACTVELKIEPAVAWMSGVDPDLEMTCVVGVRREESKARLQWPEHVQESRSHGGRDLWAPLVRVRQAERDALIDRAGFDVLPHRSRECYPCINANRADLLDIDDDRVDLIESLEREASIERQQDVYMKKPSDHGGACGIREVMRWANSSRGRYVNKTRLPIYAGEEPEDQPGIQLDLVRPCDGGWCGI